MKQIKSIFLFAFVMLFFSCAEEQLRADHKAQQKDNGKQEIKFATSVLGLDNNININIVENATTRGITDIKHNAKTRATGDGLGQSDGFIELEANSELGRTLSIDADKSNFQTWLFITNPTRWKMGYARLDWDKKEVVGNKIRLSIQAKDITFTWLGDADQNTLPEPNEKWYVAAVLGGGKLSYQTGTAERYKNILNGFIEDLKGDGDTKRDQIAFELDFKDGTQAQKHLQVPYASTWQPLTVLFDNGKPRLRFGLDLTMQGNLIRTDITEDNTISEPISQPGSNYDWNANTEYYKHYILRTTMFYQPVFVFPYRISKENNKDLTGQPIMTAVLNSDPNANQEMVKKLIPADDKQDFYPVIGRHVFFTWGVPHKLKDEQKAESDDFYTLIVPSNGGFVLGTSLNNYVGEAVFTGRPARRGTLYNLGQLKEINPAITPEMAKAAGMSDDRVMEYPNPLEAIAEFNLGPDERVSFAKSSTIGNLQGNRSRSQLYDENDRNIASTKYFPSGYRGMSIKDQGILTPYIDGRQGKSVYWAELTNGNEFDEYLNMSYIFQGTMTDKNIDYTDNVTAFAKTRCKYWSKFLVDRDDARYNVYAKRFMAQGDDVAKSPSDRAKFGNSHLTAYFWTNNYMEGTPLANVTTTESYMPIKSVYIGNAPVTDEMIRDDKWWAIKRGKALVIRNIPFVGENLNRAFTGYKVIWDDKSYWGPVWNKGGYNTQRGEYLYLTCYDGGSNNAYVYDYTRTSFYRRSAQEVWGLLVRPIKNFKRL